MPIRLKVKGPNDSRFVNSQPLVNSSGDVYSIIIDRNAVVGQILDANGATVAQCDGEGSIPKMLQAMKNYMIDNLGMVFFQPNKLFNETAISVAAPSTNTLNPDNTPTSGSVIITYDSVNTPAIAFDATAADVQASLRSLADLQDITVSGTMATLFTVTNSGVISPLTYATTSNTLQRDEVVLIEFDAVPDSGTFKITYDGNESAAINFDAIAADIETEIQLLAGLETATVAGSFAAGFTITLTQIISPTAITVTSNSLMVGIAPTAVGTTVTIPTPFVAQTDQQVTITFDLVPDGGAFKLTYNGNESAAIAFSDNAAAVEVALQALAGLSTVTVAGDFTTGFIVTMVGITSPLALTATSNTLLNVATPVVIAVNITQALVPQVDEITLVAFDAIPESGGFRLSYNGNECSNQSAADNAAAVQEALRLVPGLSTVTVTGSFAAGFSITMVGIVAPTAITVSFNTLSDDAVPVDDTITIPTAFDATSIVIA
jgi:hypothetical protein